MLQVALGPRDDRGTLFSLPVECLLNVFRSLSLSDVVRHSVSNRYFRITILSNPTDVLAVLLEKWFDITNESRMKHGISRLIQSAALNASVPLLSLLNSSFVLELTVRHELLKNLIETTGRIPLSHIKYFAELIVENQEKKLHRLLYPSNPYNNDMGSKLWSEPVQGAPKLANLGHMNMILQQTGWGRSGILV
ncbi:hypothetical protein BJ742DRAFT_736835 [Cladochytrium replicatum]|nr:hypothetical protein BJ742DRAFT_736835 [Cladochytrium replicatum]